jgi:alkylated DNA repair dioxygenase AlkB
MQIEKIEIIEDYVDEDFIQKFLERFPMKEKTGRSRNTVRRYGSEIPYPGVNSKKIPEIFDIFKKDIIFDSVKINEYHKGQVIGWHVDELKGGPEIVILSLLSDANLDFRKVSNHSEKVSYRLPKGSLTRISNDLRYNYEHYLAAEDKRYSIVFRNSADCTVK